MFLGALFSLSSCMNYNLTSKSTFDSTVDSVRVKMSELGFSFVGTRNITNKGRRPITNERQETFYFADSLGKTLSYSVSYGEWVSLKKGIVYVKDVELCDCETSDPDDFERLCDNEAIVKQISNIPKDQKVKRITIVTLFTSLSALLLVLILYDSFFE